MIRLVTVIVLVGLLAVTATLKMLNFQSDAREKTLHSLVGTIHATSNIVYSKVLVRGEETKCYPRRKPKQCTDSKVDLNAPENASLKEQCDAARPSNTFAMDDIYICNGYPSAHIDNVEKAFNIKKPLIVTNVPTSGSLDSGLAAHISFPKNGKINYNCRVIYTDAKDTGSYTVEFINSDC